MRAESRELADDEQQRFPERRPEQMKLKITNKQN